MLSRRGFRLAALIAAFVCVLAIAAGAFAFSYLGVRDTALAAGVNPRLARFYPLVFDAVLVVACAAAVTLRGALRVFAWLAVLVVIGAVATADTVHVMSITVPQRQLGATIAIAPWVALLTGLTLLDAMFRRAAPRRRAEAAGPVPANGRAPAAGSPDSPAAQPGSAAVVPLSTLLHDSPATPAARPRVTASQTAAAVGLPGTTPSHPAAAVGQPERTPSQPAAAVGQPERTPSQPAAAVSQPVAGVQPTTTASQPAVAAGQPDAPASPAKTTTSPGAVDLGQRAAAGSPPVVAQAVPAPQAPEPDAPGDADPGPAATVAYLDRMRGTPTPPEG
jgi:hypothetical protein